jgi:thymidine kinase
MAKLIVITGGMFSGKSTELIRQGERQSLAGRRFLFLKPDLDVRYGSDTISTHKGVAFQAFNVSVSGNIVEFVKQHAPDVEVVLIDEVQFFRLDIVDSIMQLVDQGVDVYVSGLDMDFAGHPFLTTERLMGLADEVHKLHAVCEDCGADAVYSVKKGNEAKRIQLGGKELYMPLCRACRLKALKGRKE